MKALNREQLQKRKEKAVRFVRDVLDDPDRAAEIEDEDLDDYAQRKKVQIINPTRRRTSMPTSKQLRQRIRELEEENQDLSDQLDAVAEIVSPDEEEEEESGEIEKDDQD